MSYAQYILYTFHIHMSDYLHFSGYSQFADPDPRAQECGSEHGKSKQKR